MKLFVLIVVILAVVIALIDLAFYEFLGEKWLLTTKIREASHKYPAFTFGIGFLCGHLFACSQAC